MFYISLILAINVSQHVKSLHLIHFTLRNGKLLLVNSKVLLVNSKVL